MVKLYFRPAPEVFALIPARSRCHYNRPRAGWTSERGRGETEMAVTARRAAWRADALHGSKPVDFQDDIGKITMTSK